jgi:hypothetical protein
MLSRTDLDSTDNNWLRNRFERLEQGLGPPDFSSPYTGGPDYLLAIESYQLMTFLLTPRARGPDTCGVKDSAHKVMPTRTI